MSATASVMEPTNRSEIGSGRRRGRGRGRGRGQGVSRAGTAQNRPSQGWSINVPVEVPIVLQDGYTDNTIGERSRLFCLKAMERLGYQLRMKGLQSTRVGITILLVNDVLTQCLHWLQDHVRLHDVGNAPELSMSAMYQYLAMMLYSHCTGFSLNHTWTIMEKLNQHTPSLDVIRFISQNILAFSPSNRGNMGANSWSSQRDMTPNLTAFEKVSFSVSNSIFVVPNHTTATLDDDLYGTRASDNQVKTISNRKSDKEGHCADVIADPLFRITLGIRFRRRGESQERNVDRLLNYILDACGEQSLNGFVMTADRGYGSMSLLKAMLSHGIGCIFIMPEHLKKCHPVVGKSFLNLDRDEEIEGEPSSSTGSDSGDDVDQESLLTASLRLSDRPGRFIIDDSANAGPASFHAKRSVKVVGQRASTRSRIDAVAVREYGDAKYSKVIRFLFSVPSELSNKLHGWIAVPKPTDLSNHLFSARRDDGRLVVPNSTSNEARERLASWVYNNCIVLTVGQRCADWFIMRQFRITGTCASELLLSSNDVCRLLNIAPNRRVFSLGEHMNMLTNSWFSSSRSTESMKRGQCNEEPVVLALRQRSFIMGIFECGLLALKENPWIACSPDGVALVDIGSLKNDSSSILPVVASVEIKTSVASSSVDRILGSASVNAIVCEFGDNTFNRCIPREHVGQLLDQMIELGVNHVVYVSASETGIMWIAVAECNDEILDVCRQHLLTQAQQLVAWAHATTENVVWPVFAQPQDLKQLKDRFVFWRQVNCFVRQNDPFSPLKKFKHACQTLYSKTKCGVDGGAQTRAILRSSTSSLKWEQKIVSQVLKTVVVNSFFSWRMFTQRHLLTDRSTFVDLTRFRGAMNKLQSFADFIGELSSEMLDYANELKSTELSATGEQSLQSEEITDDAEVRRLRSLARGKQRSRLNWFNSSDGKRLRVNIPHHSQRQILPQKRCCLCGNTPGCKRHQSSYKCTFCDVHLCIKVRPPGRKSCWQIWHTKAVLEARGYGERLFPNEHLGDDDDDPAQSSTRRTRQRVA